MRKLTAAAILTATAAVLAFRPSREWIGDAMIDAGIRLAYGEPPPMQPRPHRFDTVATIDAATLDALAAELRAGKRRNGDSPV